ANHPYGVLDGIVLTWLAMQVRPEVKVLANSVLNQAQEIRPHLLPIDFSTSKEAVATTIASRGMALAALKQGDAIGIFPGGGVSTSPQPMKGPALDLEWIPFTARLIHQSQATVVPIYFSGQNSRLFQLASHISPTLRLSLIFHETVRRMGTSIKIRIGDPIQYDEISDMRDRDALVKYLRKMTFALAARPEIDWMKATKLRA
ncbi:MAG: lysophospholipid acyltransferase family protein, partial [Hyphomicrobiales bacterium]